MPYISASIILQLGGAVIPYFQKLQREGEEGRKKITQLTRYGTVAIAGFQSWGIAALYLPIINYNGMPIIPAEVQGFMFTFSTVMLLTAGTVLSNLSGCSNTITIYPRIKQSTTPANIVYLIFLVRL